MPVKPKGSKANVRRVFDLADVTDYNEGLLSYRRYNEVMQGLADYYGVRLPAAVAVFCALSPNSDYKGNLRSAASVLKGFTEGVPVEFIRVSTYKHCRDRAYSYLTGVNFLASVSGKKIASFYRNILNPDDPEPVTIDGHAVNVWRGRRENLKAVVVGRGFNYDQVARDYRLVARDVGLLPNQVQSVTWFTWKRIHSILNPARQLHLFKDVSADLWQTLADPASIEPFEYFKEPSPSTLKKPI